MNKTIVLGMIVFISMNVHGSEDSQKTDVALKETQERVETSVATKNLNAKFPIALRCMEER